MVWYSTLCILIEGTTAEATETTAIVSRRADFCMFSQYNLMHNIVFCRYMYILSYNDAGHGETPNIVWA